MTLCISNGEKKKRGPNSVYTYPSAKINIKTKPNAIYFQRVQVHVE